MRWKYNFRRLCSFGIITIHHGKYRFRSRSGPCTFLFRFAIFKNAFFTIQVSTLMISYRDLLYFCSKAPHKNNLANSSEGHLRARSYHNRGLRLHCLIEFTTKLSTIWPKRRHLVTLELQHISSSINTRKGAAQ